MSKRINVLVEELKGKGWTVEDGTDFDGELMLATPLLTLSERHCYPLSIALQVQRYAEAWSEHRARVTVDDATNRGDGSYTP